MNLTKRKDFLIDEINLLLKNNYTKVKYFLEEKFNIRIIKDNQGIIYQLDKINLIIIGLLDNTLENLSTLSLFYIKIQIKNNEKRNANK